MNPKLTTMILLLIPLSLLCPSNSVMGSPFVPLAWQARVKSGPLENQRKHVGWARDLNGDFIDDGFLELNPGDLTDVILQLSSCASPAEITYRFSPFGTIETIGELVAYVYLSGVPVDYLSLLAQDPLVAAVERPHEYQASLDTSTRSVRARRSVTYDPETFAEAFAAECGGSPCDGTGVNIAIVDSGVNDDHIAFDDKFVAGYYPSDDIEMNPDDVTGHGTLVAGIAMGLPVGPGCSDADDESVPNNCEGMAPGAGLIDVRVLNSEGSLPFQFHLTKGLEWIWKDGQADVVNISINHFASNYGEDSTTQHIDALVANGISVSVSVGNEIWDPGDNSWKYKDVIDSVAASELAVTVGASNDQNTVDRANDPLWSHSRCGPRRDLYYQYETLEEPESDFQPTVGMLKPDIVAPGAGIRSADADTTDGYRGDSGTSFASPHVAGAMALLLQMRPNLPPGALKDLLRRSAFQTSAHLDALVDDDEPWRELDPPYHSHWGKGLLDVYEAGRLLSEESTDLSFPDCIDAHDDYPDVRRCKLSGGKESYKNTVDITLETDPPVQGEPNTIYVHIENRGPGDAENIVVSVGVQDLGVGVYEFYDVGSKVVASLTPGSEPTIVPFPWTPVESDHQCIQATIDYGLDTDFSNNTTGRNVMPIDGSSPSTAEFRVQNPLHEEADILLEVKLDKNAEALLPYVYVFGVPTGQAFTMSPSDCPILAQIDLMPYDDAPVGAHGTINIAARAYSDSYPQGIELSGIIFEYQVVDPGMNRVYSVARHSDVGDINLTTALSGMPTSDPRRQLNRIKAVFNVPVKPPINYSLKDCIKIYSKLGSTIPPFEASFPDGAAAGKEIIIKFKDPLPDQDRYGFGFYGLIDLDEDPLTSPQYFEFRVAQGDADGSGEVTDTDISFVRERINREVEYGPTCRADCNRTGTITGADISYVRGRIGNSAP